MRTRPSTLAFANFVLCAVSAASLAFCIYSILNHKSHLAVRLAPAIAAMTLPLLLKFSAAVRVGAAFVLVGAGVGLYSAQLFALLLTDPDRPSLQAMQKEAKAAHVAFDGRTRIEVIEDLRSHGTTAYPPFYPYLLLDSPLKIDGAPIVPLGSISNAVTVCCDEGGSYLIYKTDEHGFVNPAGAWAGAPVEIALVGASTAVGESVAPADAPATQIRERYPHTVSLGAGGNGPLLELASIREYLPALKPRRVLWIFSESHTPEYLQGESHSALLLRYFDPSYRQGLLEKQDAINQAVKNYFEDGIRAEEMTESWSMAARRFVLLKSIRAALYYFVAAKTARPKPLEFDSKLYERALLAGKGMIESWGGTVTLVYWPDSSRYAGICNYSPTLRAKYDRTRDAFLGAAKQTGLPVIDLSEAFPDLPASESARNTEYFYPYPAHFKPAGYHRATKAILDALEAKP